jgi:hypothetical protein
MKRLVTVGALGLLALGGTAVAAGPVIVKGGQKVTLPCTVNGSVVVDAGGSVATNPDCSTTTIRGTLDIHPGGSAGICHATITGALLAHRVVAGTFVDASTVRAATSNDGSLSISSSSCEQQT